jgi:uncharacterized protein YdaU (DUF1376 family)
MHYYQFNIGDYVSHTNHLDPIEDIAYRRMLDWCYTHETVLPKDVQEISRLIRMRDHAAAIREVLNEFFELTENGWFSSRVQREIDNYRTKVEQASKAGKASAQRRLNARSTDVQPTNNQEPLTINQEPNNSVAKATGDKSPLTADEIIFGYGLPLLTNAGTADKQARSFLGGLRKSHGDESLVNALRECIRAKPLQPLEWLAKVLPPEGAKPKLNKQEALEASNRAVVERLLKKEGLV